MSLGSFGTPLSPLPPLPPKKNKKRSGGKKKTREWGVLLFFFLSLSDTLSITLVVSGPSIGGVVCLWFIPMCHWLMLLIVPVRVQDSRCMGLGPVSWGLSIPAGVR